MMSIHIDGVWSRAGSIKDRHSESSLIAEAVLVNTLNLPNLPLAFIAQPSIKRGRPTSGKASYPDPRPFYSLKINCIVATGALCMCSNEYY
jgi:hypothetical protein